MEQKSIYRSSQGEAALQAIYDRKLAQLGITTESRVVSTRFGKTHVLVTGSEDGMPVVMLHGGNSINPETLGWIIPLMERYRIYAPDTIGHPGKSAPVRLSPRDNSYGQWLADVLDGLELAQVALMGGSYGAGILLCTTVYAPERIAKAILLVPSGIVSIPLRTMVFELLLPLMVYNLAPSRSRLENVLRPMFVGALISEDVIETTELVFKYVHVEPEMPRNVTKEELAHFDAPVLILAAENDRLFPANLVLPRARQIFPNLAAAEIIPDSPHFISPTYLPTLNQRIDRFLRTGQ